MSDSLDNPTQFNPDFQLFFVFFSKNIYHNQALELDFLIPLASFSQNVQSSVTCHLSECISLWKSIEFNSLIGYQSDCKN